jgi:predicted nucleotide-binding protein (sugar kinase/HSP70/actin superfamily)
MKTKNLIKQIKAFFSGDKIMTEVTKAANYTEEMVDAMVADYQDSPSKDTVAKLAKEFNKSTRSIVAKLVREGVYVAAPRVTKAGAPVVRKSELVAQVQELLGVEMPTLEKASKQDLESLLCSITTMSER